MTHAEIAARLGVSVRTIDRYMAPTRCLPLHPNPNDTTYGLKDQDREKYAAIGGRDHFVLKFQKPFDAK